MDAGQADAVVHILGLAINFSSPIQLAALIILCIFLLGSVWLFTRVGSANHDVERLKTATATNDAELVTQIAGRYGVNLADLSPKQKFAFAMEQVRAARIKFLVLMGCGLVSLCQNDCWEKFTKQQIDVVRGVVRSTYDGYRKVPLLGHSDVGDDYLDPGPAFPIDQLRKEFGFETKASL